MSVHLIFLRTLILNGIFYGSVGFLPWLSPFVIEEMTLDKWIGFHPYSIYLYFSFFVLIWHSFIKLDNKSVKEIAILIPFSALFAAIFYIVFPTTIIGVNQTINSDLFTSNLYYLLNKNDTHMNCLPSLHGAITVICMYYLLKNDTRFWLRLTYSIWGIAICWSAIAIRQHLSLDIILGMIYGGFILSLKSGIIKVSETIIQKFKRNEILKK